MRKRAKESARVCEPHQVAPSVLRSDVGALVSCPGMAAAIAAGWSWPWPPASSSLAETTFSLSPGCQDAGLETAGSELPKSFVS